MIGTVTPPRSGFGDGRIDIPPSIGIVKQLGVFVQRHDVRFLGFNINHTDGDQSQLPIQGTFRAGTSSRPETLAKQVPIQNLTFRFHTVGPGRGLAEVQIWARR